MARIALEGKVPMPVGGWEPSRQLGHEGEVRNDIPTNQFFPIQAISNGLGGLGMGELGPPNSPDPVVEEHRTRPDILPRRSDSVEFETGSYQLGGHTGTLSPTEQQEVLQVVARSIVRSLQEEAQRVQEKYAMQLPVREVEKVQPQGSLGFQDVFEVPREVPLEIETLEEP